MKFLIQGAHTELYKEYFELVQLFVYKPEIFLNALPEGSTADFYLFGEEERQGNRIFITYIAKYQERHIQTSLDENISTQDVLLYNKTYKRLIKKTIYEALKKVFGKQSPWGSLTGVRPSYLLYEQILQGKSLEEAKRFLLSEFDLDKQKADLLGEIILVQSEMKQSQSNDVDVYIGIPFCASRCSYCTFTSNPINQDKINAYMDALELELSAISGLMQEKGMNLRALYVGGGTPSAIDTLSFEKLFHYVNSYFAKWKKYEYTVEAGRADTISRDKLQLMADFNVERISINPQSMNNETLQKIGRNHSAEECIAVYNLARELGFSHINMDTIVGLPGEGLSHFQHTMRILQELKPESITVHTLSLKKNSLLTATQNHRENNKTLADMVQHGYEVAKSMGMRPYYLYRQKNIAGNHENTAYAIAGKECLYNVDIMEENTSILAAGAAGISKRIFPGTNKRIERAPNVCDLTTYIKNIEEMIERKVQLFL